MFYLPAQYRARPKSSSLTLAYTDQHCCSKSAMKCKAISCLSGYNGIDTVDVWSGPCGIAGGGGGGGGGGGDFAKGAVSRPTFLCCYFFMTR